MSTISEKWEVGAVAGSRKGRTKEWKEKEGVRIIKEEAYERRKRGREGQECERGKGKDIWGTKRGKSETGVVTRRGRVKREVGEGKQERRNRAARVITKSNHKIYLRYKRKTLTQFIKLG